MGSVVRRGFGHPVSDDDAVLVHAKMELPPATDTPFAVLRRRPLPFPADREAAAIKDEDQRIRRCSIAEFYVEGPRPPRQGRVIRHLEIESHQLKDGTQEPLGLAEWKVEDESQR